MKEKKYRLREAVYRLGYALYAKHLQTGNGRSNIIGKGNVRQLTLHKFEDLRTYLYKEHGMMW